MTRPWAYGDLEALLDFIYMIGGLGEMYYIDSVESYQDGVGWHLVRKN